MATVAILKNPRPECTFLWSLVKIGSSCSENLVGQVHSEKKRKNNNNNKKRCKNNKSSNFVWGLNNNKKQSKSNMSHKLRLGAIIIRNGANTMSPKLCLGDIIIRNGAKTISLQTLFGRLIYLPLLEMCKCEINRREARVIMVFNTTLKNISVIKWKSILLVEKTRLPREIHWPAARNY